MPHRLCARRRSSPTLCAPRAAPTATATPPAPRLAASPLRHRPARDGRRGRACAAAACHYSWPASRAGAVGHCAEQGRGAAAATESGGPASCPTKSMKLPEHVRNHLVTAPKLDLMSKSTPMPNSCVDLSLLWCWASRVCRFELAVVLGFTSGGTP